MKHVHRYERRRLGTWKKTGHEIYKCATAGCGHYMTDMEAVIGRFSLCWGVDGPGTSSNLVEMTRYLVINEKRKRPICDTCKEKRKENREAYGDNDATINA